MTEYAAWGVDYLKYDGDNPEGYETEATYACLASAPRDIVYSLSNNAGCDPSGAHPAYYARYVNAWRIGYDLSDAWSAILDNGFVGFDPGHGNMRRPVPEFWAQVTGPGRWADADMLMVGLISPNGDPRPHESNLTADEQYVHLTQWAMLASPILAGCDLVQISPFTLGLLSNDEVLAVDQDPLGLQATRIVLTGDPRTGTQVWARELEDGSRAVALYNLGDSLAPVTAQWADLGVQGRQSVRDLWRQTSVGEYTDAFSAEVPKHGVVLVAVTPVAAGRPQITEQPVDVTVGHGMAASFHLQATGSGAVHYQWARNSKEIPGATEAAYTLPAANLIEDDGACFRCRVTNRLGSVRSYEVVLKVLGVAGVNLARNKPVTVPGMQRITSGYPHTVTDGDPTTGWQSLPLDAAWAYIDLGVDYSLSAVEVTWDYDAAKDYDIQVASDGAIALDTEAPWKTAHAVQGNAGRGSFRFPVQAVGRFVRIAARSHVSQANCYRLNEVSAYGEPVTPARLRAHH